MSKKLTPEEKEYRALTASLRDLARTKHGQAVLWHILGMCDLYSDTFTGNNHTFYLEGKRAVGLGILAFMEDADPTMYARLLLEQQKTKEVIQDE